MKLTKTQQELFNAMKAGVSVYFMGYMGRFNPSAYYYRADNNRRVTAAAKALLEKGLATLSGDLRDRELKLKDAPNVKVTGAAPHEQETKR